MRTSFAIVQQSVRSVSRQLARSTFTAFGVALGVWVFLTSVAWSTTVSSVVNADFDATLSTRIVISGNSRIGTDAIYRNDFDAHVEALAGVEHAGLIGTVGAYPVARSVTTRPTEASVLAATPGAVEASGAGLRSGRMYQSPNDTGAPPQAVLGAALANNLGVTGVSGPVAVLVDGRAVPVVGVLAGPGSQPEFGQAILVGPWAVGDFGMPEPTDWTGIIRTELGAATTVARALPLAVSPEDPGGIGVALPPSPEQLRGNVESSLNGMALGAGGLALVVGSVGIMNAILTSVQARAGEIGLRRALGARPRHIALQILAEGALLGGIGAIIGTALGATTLITMSWFSGWQPVAEKWLFLVSPLAGSLIGMVAGVYPALRAARLLPAEALRR